MHGKTVVAIVSGGLDSVTMLYEMQHIGYEADVVSFNYGQRHKKELVFAKAAASRFQLKHDVIDLSQLGALFSPSGSALVDIVGSEVPEGHYEQENMSQTVVPNRNMIMLSIAAGIAVARDVDNIAAAMHAGDHFIYPDCRPEFIAAANAAICVGNDGFGKIQDDPNSTEWQHFILAPYLHWSKADIAFRALQLNVPLHETWSCYKGGANHCGRCGTCVERLEAINNAQQRYAAHGDHVPTDHTVYDDTEYWKLVVAQRNARNAADNYDKEKAEAFREQYNG